MRDAIRLSYSPADHEAAAQISRLITLGGGRLTDASGPEIAHLCLWSRHRRGRALGAHEAGPVIPLSLDGAPFPEALREAAAPHRIRLLRALANAPGDDLSTVPVLPGLMGRVASLDRLAHLGFTTTVITAPVVAALILSLEPGAVFLTFSLKARVIAMLCVMMVMVSGLWSYSFARLDLKALGRRVVEALHAPAPAPLEDQGAPKFWVQ